MIAPSNGHGFTTDIPVFKAPVFLCTMALLLILVNGPLPHVGNAAASSGSPPLRILAFGDSLVAGYGVKQSESFPRQLEDHLVAKGHRVEVINAGVSGDTSAGGLARIDWALEEQYDLVIVELGANDGLRGLDPDRMAANLEQIIRLVKQSGAKVLLAGMRAPANMGRDYATRFEAVYPDLADRLDVALYPFFLDGVAGDASFNQGDGIHPNARGVAKIVQGIGPMVEQIIDELHSKRAQESACTDAQ